MSDSDETRLVTGASNRGPDNDITINLPDIEIEEELGRGGMGIVYKGRQTYIDRPVAIKVLLRDPGEGSLFVARFQRESKDSRATATQYRCLPSSRSQ